MLKLHALTRFRLSLLLIFVVLLLPTIYLLYRSWEHLRTEAAFGQKERAFLQLQMLNQRIFDDLAIEERRSYTEYRFIRAVPVIGGEGVTLSDLAHFPIQSQYAGMVGYFQLEPDGRIRTPVLPDGLLGNITVENRIQREAVRDSITRVLSRFSFLGASSIGGVNAGRGDSPFPKRYETASEKEQMVFNVESGGEAAVDAGVGAGSNVEIEPFQVRFNESHLVFYRNVWRDTKRFLQGYMVDMQTYLKKLAIKDINLSGDEGQVRIDFLHRDTVLTHLGQKANADEAWELLLVSPLQFPLQEIDVAVYRHSVGTPPGAGLIVVLGSVMLLILGAGLYGVYKITSTQMRISAKRQDFISAVSHELKTPLTAIRMYAEMLQNQWVVKEEKRQHYYHIIFGETERLTRLIQNVLNISNLEKHRWPIQLVSVHPGQFLEEFVAKYSATVERNGFHLECSIEPCNDMVYIDKDAMSQVLVNLIENAQKFAKNCEPKTIEVGLKVRQEDWWISVRDYGPGIPANERSRVFQDFYRVENEMTRSTSGAGIGLSLVNKFCQFMNIRILLHDAHPGLLVELHLPMQNHRWS